MQAADRQQMGEAAVPHRLRIDFGNMTLIAGDQSRTDTTGSCRHVVDDMLGQSSPAVSKQRHIGRQLIQRNIAQSRSAGTDPLKPRTPCKIVTSGQCRSGGGHEACAKPNDSARLKTFLILLWLEIDPDVCGECLMTSGFQL